MLAEQIENLEKAASQGKPVPPSELQALKQVAQDLAAGKIDAGALAQLGPESFAAVTGELVIRKDAGMLQKISELPLGRDRRKVLKKSLHVLKSLGVAVPEKKSERRVTVQAQVLAEWALATPVMIMNGQQLVYYFLSGSMGNNFLLIHTDPLEGILEFTNLKVNESRARKIAERSRISSEIPVPVVKVSKDHFLWLMGLARAHCKDPGKNAELDQTIDKLKLPGPRPGEEHPVLEMVDLEKVRGNANLVFEADRLLEHPFFKHWEFMPEIIKSCSQDLDQAGHSPLQLSESQLWERMEGAFEKWAITGVKKHAPRIKFALMENAFLMKAAGQDDFAEIALALAFELEEEDAAVPDFFKKLLIRSFPEAWKKLGRKTGSLIISAR